MLVMSDTEDVFLPRPTDLLINLTESRASVESLLTRINDMFKENHTVGSAMGPALQAGFKLIVRPNFLLYSIFILIDCIVFAWWPDPSIIVVSSDHRSRSSQGSGWCKNIRYREGMRFSDYWCIIINLLFRNPRYCKRHLRSTRHSLSNVLGRIYPSACSCSAANIRM